MRRSVAALAVLASAALPSAEAFAAPGLTALRSDGLARPAVCAAPAVRSMLHMHALCVRSGGAAGCLLYACAARGCPRVAAGRPRRREWPQSDDSFTTAVAARHGLHPTRRRALHGRQ